MNIINLVFAVLVVRGVEGGTDPAACQRAIKYMLIKACGEAKRHAHTLGLTTYLVLTAQQVDRKYEEMVQADMIKGVKREASLHHIDDNTISDDKPAHHLYFRKKRSFMDNKDRFITDPFHTKRGTHYYAEVVLIQLPEITRDDRSPLPGALKTKCCGGYLCTMDDFRGFCE